MAIDIVTIKNACQNIQDIAVDKNEGYNKILILLDSAKNSCKAETINLNGATLARPFDALTDLVKQVQNATIQSANATYDAAKEIYACQKAKEEEEQKNSN